MPTSVDSRAPRGSFDIVRAVVFALVLREMRGRFGRVRMGAFWTLFEPLVHIAIITIVIGTFRSNRLPGFEYQIFLLTGLAPFLLFKNIALKLIDAGDANRALFAYKQITPFDTFVARAIVELCLATAVYLLVLSGLGWWGFDVRVRAPLEWLGMISLGIAFAFSLGITFAIVVHSFPEAKFVIRLLFWPMYIISAVIFPASSLPPQYLDYFLWNPFFHILELIRYNVFNFYPIVSGVSFVYVVEVTVVFSFVSMMLYRVRRHILVTAK